MYVIATVRRVLLVAAAASFLTGGCGLGDNGPCLIADGQEPLEGLTPEQKLEQLTSSTETGWPDLPDGDWEREDVGETIVFRNGDAEVSFLDDALVSVATC